MVYPLSHSLEWNTATVFSTATTKSIACASFKSAAAPLYSLLTGVRESDHHSSNLMGYSSIVKAWITPLKQLSHEVSAGMALS